MTPILKLGDKVYQFGLEGDERPWRNYVIERTVDLIRTWEFIDSKKDFCQYGLEGLSFRHDNTITAAGLGESWFMSAEDAELAGKERERKCQAEHEQNLRDEIAKAQKELAEMEAKSC